MARLTRTIDLRVIHNDHGDPRRVVMAGFARIGGIDMVCGFTRRRCSIVAVKTGLPQHGGVIELRIPVIGIVAGIARFSRGQVIRPFAYGD